MARIVRLKHRRLPYNERDTEDGEQSERVPITDPYGYLLLGILNHAKQDAIRGDPGALAWLLSRESSDTGVTFEDVSEYHNRNAGADRLNILNQLSTCPPVLC